MRKPPILRRKCPRWYSSLQSLAPPQIPLFHFRENCCLQVSHRWYAGGTNPPLFHLCSTCGPAKRGQVEHPQALALSQKSWSVPPGPPKNNIPPHPRATAALRPCVGFFPGGAGTYPARAAEATLERVAGKRKRTVPVILNEVKNPFSLLRVNRDGTGIRILRLRCAPLRMTATKGLHRTAAHDVRRCWQSSPFPSACAICPLSQDTAPTGRGMRKQDNGRVLTPAPGHTGRQSRPGKREFSGVFRLRLLNLHKEENLVKLHPLGVTPKPESPDFSALSGV